MGTVSPETSTTHLHSCISDEAWTPFRPCDISVVWWRGVFHLLRRKASLMNKCNVNEWYSDSLLLSNLQTTFFTLEMTSQRGDVDELAEYLFGKVSYSLSMCCLTKSLVTHTWKRSTSQGHVTRLQVIPPLPWTPYLIKRVVIITLQSRGELRYLAPLCSENISAPYFKQCFFHGGGGVLPPRLSQTPRLPVPRQE